jgi:hypothetical protein
MWVDVNFCFILKTPAFGSLFGKCISQIRLSTGVKWTLSHGDLDKQTLTSWREGNWWQMFILTSLCDRCRSVVIVATLHWLLSMQVLMSNKNSQRTRHIALIDLLISQYLRRLDASDFYQVGANGHQHDRQDYEG